MTAALDGHAEQALAELTSPQQKIAEILFRALTERNSEGKDTRRPVSVRVVLEMMPFTPPQTARPKLSAPVRPPIRVTRNETILYSIPPSVRPEPVEGAGRTDAERAAEQGDSLIKVIDTFRQAGRNFLMPPPDVAITPDTTLDISHESLIRQWVRLQNWVADEAEQATLYQRLSDAAQRYAANKGEYWHGSDLLLALVWQRTAEPTAAWANRYGDTESYALAMRFLQDSQADAQRLEAEKELRRKVELKRVRTQRLWLGAGLLVTSLLAGWAMLERDRAKQETMRANAAEKLALNQSFEEDMVKIPAGKFVMGCQDGRDSDCDNDEKPAHSVNVPNFAISKYEVTQGQWAMIMGSNPSYFKDCGNNCPVEQVSWEDIQTFIQKLNAKTGQHYRLPSEAEWEYACRAGQNHLYCGGNKLDDVAWHDGNSGNFLGKNQQPHPVAQKQANAFGLYDMSGNVWEWVQDSYHSDYKGAPSNGNAWEDIRADARVLRGGSWYSIPQNVRAANRGRNDATNRDNNVGFRLARTLP